MIPIECPRCGQTGKVPPDSLNARMVCKGCHSAFHMDQGGKIVLGEPGAVKAASKPKISAPAIEFDFAETWRGVPRPAKVAVPSLLLLMAGWIWFPGGPSGPAYRGPAEAIGRAMLAVDRARVIAQATPETAEKWYELVHAPIAAKGPGKVPADAVSADLIDGNPETGTDLNVAIMLATDTIATSFNVQMVKTEGEWRFDALRSLNEVQRMAASYKLAKKH